MAQDTQDPPGSRFFLDFSSGLEISDNFDRVQDPDGTSTVFTNTFAFTFDSATRNQRLTATAGVTFEAGEFADDPTGDDGGFDRPFLTLDYTRSNRTSELRFSADYRERDNGFDEVEIEDADDLIVDQGRRADLNLGLGLTLGRQTPVTLVSDLAFRDTEFTDTTDEDLNDETFFSTENVLTLSLSRTTSLFFRASYSELDEDDAEDTFETNAAGRIGLNFENGRGFSGSASIGYSVNETESTVDGETDTEREDRPVAAITLRQARPDGEARATLDQEVNDQGRRTRLSFGRTLTLPRGELVADLGVSAADYDDSLRGVGSLSYTHTLPRGSFSLRFSQQVTDDSDEDGDVFITTAGLSYQRPLTPVSTFGISLDLSASEAVDAEESDSQRTSVLLSYNRELTPDWSLNTGFRHSTFRETDEAPIIENAVFARIERRFDLRP
ncbi:MAG: hypothetical protein AAGJ91_19030 [Pseudomonadota bacterium]